jgi:shikimate kinase
MLIFLIGPPGAGKSRLAPLLAQALGIEAHDLDLAIAAAAGRPIVEIFALEGEAAFRQQERLALEAAIARGSGVVATGAGIVQDATSRALLRSAGQVVFLNASPATQAHRLGADAERAARPLLADAADLPARLSVLFTERLAGYRAAAHLEIATDAADPAQLATQLAARLGPALRGGR